MENLLHALNESFRVSAKEELGSSILTSATKRFCLFLCRASSLLCSRGNSSAVLGQWSACGACGAFRS